MGESLADTIERRCRERPDLSSAQIAGALDCRPEYVRVVAQRRGFKTNGGKRAISAADRQSAIDAAVKAERERCARIAEEEAERIDADRGLSGDSAIATNIAVAIRALIEREGE